jgi:hypothetical protein
LLDGFLGGRGGGRGDDFGGQGVLQVDAVTWEVEFGGVGVVG